MRQRILKQLYSFSIVPSILMSQDEMETLVNLLHALTSKGEAIGELYPDAVVVSGDQVMTLDDQILGKPSDKEDAFQQLSQCSGKLVTSLSNVVVCYSKKQSCKKQPRVALSFAH